MKIVALRMKTFALGAMQTWPCRRGVSVAWYTAPKGCKARYRFQGVVLRESVVLELDRAGIIGRGEDAAYRIDDHSVSRSHCEVEIGPDEIGVRDLGSRNGTWINSSRVQYGRLRIGDTLTIGSLHFALDSSGDGRFVLTRLGDKHQDGSGKGERRDGGETDAIRVPAMSVEVSRAMDSMRQRLPGCVAALLIEWSSDGSLVVGQSAGGRYVLSGNVIRAAVESRRNMWALRDFMKKSESMAGLAATAVGCQPISFGADRIWAVYTYWPGGCENTDLAETTISSMTVQLGLDTLLMKSVPAPQPALPARLQFTDSPLVGRSAAFTRLNQQISRVAITDHPVTLIGPRGSGKTTVARAMHEASRRRLRPYKRMHCAKIPPTLVESELFGTTKGAYSGAMDREGLVAAASGGTIFIDSLESCPMEVQGKLLDVLEGHTYRRLGANQEHKVDVRWVVATNEDAETLLEQGRLRPDLWDRVAVQVLKLPSLADRIDDVPALAAHFLAGERLENPDLPSPIGFTPDALQELQRYDWPGNVRELMNVVRRLVTVATGELITADDVNEALALGGRRQPTRDKLAALLDMPYRDARGAFEALYVGKKLEECDGNVAVAAEKSGISRRAIYQIVERSKEKSSKSE